MLTPSPSNASTNGTVVGLPTWCDPRAVAALALPTTQAAPADALPAAEVTRLRYRTASVSVAVAGTPYDPLHYAPCCVDELLNASFGPGAFPATANATAGSALACQFALDTCVNAAWAAGTSTYNCSAVTKCLQSHVACAQNAAATHLPTAVSCPFAKDMRALQAPGRLSNLTAAADHYAGMVLNATRCNTPAALAAVTNAATAAAASSSLSSGSATALSSIAQPAGMQLVVSAPLCPTCPRPHPSGECACGTGRISRDFVLFASGVKYATDACSFAPHTLSLCFDSEAAATSATVTLLSPHAAVRRQSTSEVRCPKAGDTAREIPLLAPAYDGCDPTANVDCVVATTAVFCAPTAAANIYVVHQFTGACLQPLGDNYTCGCGTTDPLVGVDVAFWNATSATAEPGHLTFCGAAPSRNYRSSAGVETPGQGATTTMAVVAGAAGGPAGPAIQGASLLLMLSCGEPDDEASQLGGRSTLVPFTVNDGPTGAFFALIVVIIGALVLQFLVAFCCVVPYRARRRPYVRDLPLLAQLIQAMRIVEFPSQAMGIIVFAYQGLSFEALWLALRPQSTSGERALGILGTLLVTGWGAVVQVLGARPYLQILQLAEVAAQRELDAIRREEELEAAYTATHHHNNTTIHISEAGDDDDGTDLGSVKTLELPGVSGNVVRRASLSKSDKGSALGAPAAGTPTHALTRTPTKHARAWTGVTPTPLHAGPAPPSSGRSGMSAHSSYHRSHDDRRSHASAVSASRSSLRRGPSGISRHSRGRSETLGNHHSVEALSIPAHLVNQLLSAHGCAIEHLTPACDAHFWRYDNALKDVP